RARMRVFVGQDFPPQSPFPDTKVLDFVSLGVAILIEGRYESAGATSGNSDIVGPQTQRHAHVSDNTGSGRIPDHHPAVRAGADDPVSRWNVGQTWDTGHVAFQGEQGTTAQSAKEVVLEATKGFRGRRTSVLTVQQGDEQGYVAFLPGSLGQ